MRTRWIRALLGGLAGCLLASTAFAQGQPVSQGLIRDGDPPTLELLYTGDVIGYLDPCG